MNRFKKFTSMFDREKLNIYKRFLKRATDEKTSSQAPPPEQSQAQTQTKDKPKPKEEAPTLDVPIDITPKSKPPKQKHYIKDGPHLYVSKIINAKGEPMTGPQIWREYLKDPEAVKMNILESKNYLKKTVMANMRKQGKLVKAPYSPILKLHPGYELVPEKAFKRIDPQVLLTIKPRPNIKRFEKPEILELLKQDEGLKQGEQQQKSN